MKREQRVIRPLRAAPREYPARACRGAGQASRRRPHRGGRGRRRTTLPRARTKLEAKLLARRPRTLGSELLRQRLLIAQADEVVVDRKRPREHMSFGFGIHRCLGNRLAELQLRVLWEEILRRDLRIEVVDRPVYAHSNFLHAIRLLPVRIGV
jgi:Cytochrome P450